MKTSGDLLLFKEVNNNDNILKRETESLQIATQNNAIRTNYIKAKIDQAQQNSKCML